MSAAMISAFESFPFNQPSPTQSGFNLFILATNWGFSGNWNEFAAKVAGDGYDGVEVWAPSDQKNREEFLSAMSKHKLQFGLLIGSGDPDPKKHLDQFSRSLELALSMNPLYINCHSGKDWFKTEENQKIIEASYQLSKSSGITVCHETHRGRMLYSAPITRGFIEKNTDLRITADLSHWCNVHESLLEDQRETIELTLSRSEHVHARIGHPEGPQVNDPRAPEWNKVVATHLEWWDMIAQRKKTQGRKMTILTEFGPPDYMPTEPYTRKPLADQWAINVYMKDLLRKRYSS